ncbi:uncharacterized protein LOC133927109 [Phragmites australis]|uniref:uncharacterized protein LOC133927109 n=1 Tax=Phragmites australis TaxID=29695 RepID=UPI002D79A28B|nr:uncharacterized protein LOC133927109 [Phragmites australis]
MPPGKDGPISPIASPRERLGRFAKRKDALKKKIHELATLCDVAVAVVCTGPDGSGDPEFWPSKEEVNAVVRRYNALPPEQRGKHVEDHADNVARQLAEEGGKLVRALEGGVSGALGSWEGSLEGVTADKLRELLASIDGSLVAAASRVLKLQPPRYGAADRARVLLGHVDGVTVEEDSVSVTGNGKRRPQPRGEADAGGGGLGLPKKNPKLPNAAPEFADEVVAENSVPGEDVSDEVQIPQPPGDTDADDAEWMRDLVKALEKKAQPCTAAGAGIEYINVGGYVMERDAYDFIRCDLGMPPPCIGPDSPDDDGEPLRLWSWDNTMPPP